MLKEEEEIRCRECREEIFLLEERGVGWRGSHERVTDVFVLKVKIRIPIFLPLTDFVSFIMFFHELK